MTTITTMTIIPRIMFIPALFCLYSFSTQAAADLCTKPTSVSLKSDYKQQQIVTTSTTDIYYYAVSNESIPSLEWFSCSCCS